MQILTSSGLTRIACGTAIVFVFVLYDAFFVVSEGEAAVVTRLGRPIREISMAGPYWKLPTPIDQIRRIDRRHTQFATPQAAIFTRDKRNIVLTSYVVWHVERPLMFLQAVGGKQAAETSLAGMVIAAQQQRVGQYDLEAFVSTNREQIRVDEIETTIARDVQNIAIERMGIAVDQVGIERIGFPAENMSAVLGRMRTERESEANRLRAEGAKAAQSIRDEAHVKSQRVLREAREEASRIAASGEAQAAELLATAHQKNPDFHRFWSSLQASKRVLKEKATLILTSDQLFFDSLSEPPDNSSAPFAQASRSANPAHRAAGQSAVEDSKP